MKAAMMTAAMEKLRITASYSRPRAKGPLSNKTSGSWPSVPPAMRSANSA
jgi:hypothetical protein